MFQVLKQKDSSLYCANIQADVCDGPQVRLLLLDEQFLETLKKKRKKKKKIFAAVVSGFLRNRKSSNYEELVQTLLTIFRTLFREFLFLKMHFLHSHLDVFSKTLHATSDDKEEIFPPRMKTMESNYQGS